MDSAIKNNDIHLVKIFLLKNLRPSYQFSKIIEEDPSIEMVKLLLNWNLLKKDGLYFTFTDCLKNLVLKQNFNLIVEMFNFKSFSDFLKQKPEQFRESFELVCKLNNLQILRFLWHESFNGDYKFPRINMIKAMCIACENCSKDCLLYLLEKGLFDGELLLSAVKSNNIDIINTILINSRKGTIFKEGILEKACEIGNYKIVQLLIEEKINNINHTEYYDNDYGRSWVSNPLHNACINGHLEVAKLLIENGGKLPQEYLCMSFDEIFKSKHENTIEILKLFDNNNKPSFIEYLPDTLEDINSVTLPVKNFIISNLKDLYYNIDQKYDGYLLQNKKRKLN